MNMRKQRQSIILSTGAGVRVAVLDSGRDPRFSNIRDSKGKSYVLEESEIGLNVTELPFTENTDSSGHGSCVHSCILELAPDAVVDHYRILDEFNHCPSKLLCLALDHVLEKNYAIVNLSLGTRSETLVAWLVSIMKRAYESNTCIVAASSNIGNSLFPGRFTYCISVSATKANNPLHVVFHPKQVIEFSGWGVNVPIEREPGKWIKVTGSSYASGYVTGVCARIVETLGHSSPLDVKLMLREFALSTSDKEAI